MQTAKIYQFKLANQRFVRSIPECWVDRAIVLPGKAFHVGVLLWRQSGLCRSLTIRFSMKAVRARRISRWQGYQALRTLEKVGLISVKRHVGRLPIVTIVA